MWMISLDNFSCSPHQPLPPGACSIKASHGLFNVEGLVLVGWLVTWEDPWMFGKFSTCANVHVPTLPETKIISPLKIGHPERRWSHLPTSNHFAGAFALRFRERISWDLKIFFLSESWRASGSAKMVVLLSKVLAILEGVHPRTDVSGQKKPWWG